MRGLSKSLAILLTVTFAQLAHSAPTEHQVMANFKEEFYLEGNCQSNVVHLIDYLSRAKRIEVDKAQAVIVESTLNRMQLGIHSSWYGFHVFLLAGGRVYDPLLFEMLGRSSASLDDYMLFMFPSLKGLRFSSINAGAYRMMTDDKFEDMLSEYGSRLSRLELHEFWPQAVRVHYEPFTHFRDALFGRSARGS